MSGLPFPFNVRAGSRRGAPMGRPDVGDAPRGYTPMRLRRVPLDASGYDGGGAYWGQRPRGVMLFCCWTPDRGFVRYVDAASYLMAEEAVRREADADFLA
jgi:hypothetical protein